MFVGQYLAVSDYFALGQLVGTRVTILVVTLPAFTFHEHLYQVSGCALLLKSTKLGESFGLQGLSLATKGAPP